MVDRGVAAVPARRCLVFGASNVARNLSLVVAAARRSLGTPVDLMTAMGHGRGYGIDSLVLGRWLPSILQCELWGALAERPRLPTVTIMTDIGNDLLYGATPCQVSSWVDACLQRASPYSDRLVITGLPMDAVRAMGRGRFLLFRSILFPRSTLTFERAVAFSHELNEQVRQLANRYQARWIDPARDWYGWDPIHVRRGRAAAAWMAFLSPTVLAPGTTSMLKLRREWQEHHAAWRARPLHRRLFGITQRCAQPVFTLRDGTRISWY